MPRACPALPSGSAQPRGSREGQVGCRQPPAALLTIRPSLFFPPRMYRLPSLGSGRNAGLKRGE